MINATPELLTHLVKCVMSTCPEPSASQRPVAIRIISLQVVYYVRMIVDIRKRVMDPTGYWLSASTTIPLPHSVRVCIVGCGNVGSDIAKTILCSRVLHPNNLVITTRRLNKCVQFKAQGALCVSNNVQAVTGSDVVILCCLPSQLGTVAAEIADKISKSALVISTCAGVALQRVEAVLQHSLCVTTRVNQNDVATFTRLHLDTIDPHIPLPAPPAASHIAFPFRGVSTLDEIVHLIKCLVGSQGGHVTADRGRNASPDRDSHTGGGAPSHTTRKAKGANSQMLYNAVSAVLSSEVAPDGTIGLPDNVTIASCTAEDLSQALNMTVSTICDYALQQYVMYVTKV